MYVVCLCMLSVCVYCLCISVVCLCLLYVFVYCLSVSIVCLCMLSVYVYYLYVNVVCLCIFSVSVSIVCVYCLCLCLLFVSVSIVCLCLKSLSVIIVCVCVYPRTCVWCLIPVLHFFLSNYLSIHPSIYTYLAFGNFTALQLRTFSSLDHHNCTTLFSLLTVDPQHVLQGRSN